MEAGTQPVGVRRLETSSPERAAQIQGTIAEYSRASCMRCLLASVEIYRSLRQSLGAGKFLCNEAAEAVALEYLNQIEAASASSLRT